MNLEYESFRWEDAHFHKCGDDLATFKVTLELSGAFIPSPREKGIITEWVNNGWPDGDYGPGPGLVGNCGIVAKINNQWHIATYDWLRYPNQSVKDESLTSVRLEQINESPWVEWNPQSGEVVGLFVSTPVRNDARSVNQRSAIAWIRVGRVGIIAHERFDNEPVVDVVQPVEPDAGKGVDLSPILHAIDELRAEVTALRVQVGVLQHNNWFDEGAKIDLRDVWNTTNAIFNKTTTFPVYTGTLKVFGQRVNIMLTPEGSE